MGKAAVYGLSIVTEAILLFSSEISAYCPLAAEFCTEAADTVDDTRIKNKTSVVKAKTIEPGFFLIFIHMSSDL
jgi:hypothetical protein